MLTINEIFHSIQGESTFAGRPCVFVRLTACDLRCRWCDTPYAFHEGRKMSVDEVVARWDSSPDLAKNGVAFLVHGLLDYLVDGYFEAVEALDDVEPLGVEGELVETALAVFGKGIKNPVPRPLARGVVPA